MAFVRTTDSAVEPISLAEAKAHLRVDTDDEDTLIGSYIKAARHVVENISGNALVNQTWKYYADNFWFGDLLLYPTPLSSITSITYTDGDGATQTAASSIYLADTTTTPGRVRLKYNQLWPVARQQPQSVIVTFVAGHGAAGANVPECARQAVRYLVSHQFENREPVLIGTISKPLEMTIQAMLNPIRLVEFM
jgi:uncharacterized phiE125 gp8 family phage protein